MTDRERYLASMLVSVGPHQVRERARDALRSGDPGGLGEMMAETLPTLPAHTAGLLRNAAIGTKFQRPWNEG